MISSNLFDHYSFRARLQPAFLALLPAALAVFAWTGPGERWVSALWTLMGTAGLTYFLAMLARNQGKQLEPHLWRSWGGAPTTQLLRHSGQGNPVLRERWHKNLSKVVGRPFPSPEEERADAGGADSIYEAAVTLFIQKVRDDKKLHLLHKENVSYGFCRNLFALKRLGIAIAILGSLLSGAAAFWRFKLGTPLVAPWVCAACSLALLLWWVFTVKATWVRVPAFAYASRLLEATESLTRARAEKSPHRETSSAQ